MLELNFRQPYDGQQSVVLPLSILSYCNSEKSSSACKDMKRLSDQCYSRFLLSLTCLFFTIYLRIFVFMKLLSFYLFAVVMLDKSVLMFLSYWNTLGLDVKFLLVNLRNLLSKLIPLYFYIKFALELCKSTKIHEYSSHFRSSLLLVGKN